MLRLSLLLQVLPLIKLLDGYAVVGKVLRKHVAVAEVTRTFVAQKRHVSPSAYHAQLTYQ